jgi:ribonuclease PH
MRGQVAAVSCGLWRGLAVLDLDYAEDSEAEADGNFVLTEDGGIVEVQATAERRPMTQREIDSLMALARGGCSTLFDLQKEAVHG